MSPYTVTVRSVVFYKVELYRYHLKYLWKFQVMSLGKFQVVWNPMHLKERISLDKEWVFHHGVMLG